MLNFKFCLILFKVRVLYLHERMHTNGLRGRTRIRKRGGLSIIIVQVRSQTMKDYLNLTFTVKT